MDERKRRLERLARAGDHDAARRLDGMKRASGEYPECPSRLFRVKRLRHFSKTLKEPMRVGGYTTLNRNIRRLKAHSLGRCNPTKCRFCRRYGTDSRGKQ